MSDGGFGNVSNNPELGGGYSDPVAHGSSVGFGTVASNPELGGGSSDPVAHGNALTSNASSGVASTGYGGYQQSPASAYVTSVGQSSGAGSSFNAVTNAGQSSSSSAFENLHPTSQANLTALHGGDSGAASSAFNLMAGAVGSMAAGAFSTPAYAEGLVPSRPVQGKPDAFVDPFAYAGTGSIGKAASAYAGGPAPYPDAGTPYSQIERFGASFPSGLGTPQVSAAAVNPAIDPETGYEPGSLGDHLVRIRQGAGNLVSGAASGIDTWLKNPNRVDAAVNAAGSAIGNLLTRTPAAVTKDYGQYGPPLPPPSPYHEALPPPPGTPIDFSGSAATLRPVGADIPAGITDPTRATWLPDTEAAQPGGTPTANLAVVAPAVTDVSNATPTRGASISPSVAAADSASLVAGQTPIRPTAGGVTSVSPVVGDTSGYDVTGQLDTSANRLAAASVAAGKTATDVAAGQTAADVVAPGIEIPTGPGRLPSGPVVNLSESPPLPTIRPGTPNLKQGDTDRTTGGAITPLQQQLVNAGYLKQSQVDGVFGPVTAAAVRKVEADPSVRLGGKPLGRDTGVVGPQVTKALTNVPTFGPQTGLGTVSPADRRSPIQGNNLTAPQVPLPRLRPNTPAPAVSPAQLGESPWGGSPAGPITETMIPPLAQRSKDPLSPAVVAPITLTSTLNAGAGAGGAWDVTDTVPPQVGATGSMEGGIGVEPNVVGSDAVSPGTLTASDAAAGFPPIPDESQFVLKMQHVLNGDVKNFADLPTEAQQVLTAKYGNDAKAKYEAAVAGGHLAVGGAITKALQQPLSAGPQALTDEAAGLTPAGAAAASEAGAIPTHVGAFMNALPIQGMEGADYSTRVPLNKDGTPNYDTFPANPKAAVGKYQFLPSTWHDIVKAHPDVTDFTPANQDKAAAYLAQDRYKQVTGRNMEADLAAGKEQQVAKALNGTWPSLLGGSQQGSEAATGFFKAYQRNLTGAGNQASAGGTQTAGAGPVVMNGNALTDQQTAMGVTIPRDAAASGVGQPGVQVAGNDQGIPYQDNQGNVISNTDKYGLPLSVSPPVVEMNDPVTGERKNYTLEQYMQTFPDADPMDFHQMVNPINRLQDQGGSDGIPMSALPAQGVQVALMAGTGGQQPSVTQDDLSQYTPTQQKLIDRLGTLSEQDISRIMDRIDTNGVPGEETAVVPYGEKPGMKLGDDANPKGMMTWSAGKPGYGLNQMQDLPDRYYPPMRPGDEQYYKSDPGNPMNRSPATDQMWKQEDLSFPPQVMNALPAQSIQDGQYYLFTDPQTGTQTLRRANRRGGGQTAVG